MDVGNELKRGKDRSTSFSRMKVTDVIDVSI